MKNYILFDFDGTVFDTAEGITKCVQYALGKMGIEAELDELMCFAGPPLVEMFMQKYGMSEKDALHVTELYRERYLPIGWAECSPFDGMHELMQRLRAAGKKLAVATSKPERLARQILEHYSMTDDFDLVCGSEFDGTRGQKWEVIDFVLKSFGIEPEDAIMVGDRKYDVIGAKKCGLDCVGVRFGYAEPNELEEHGAVYIAETADDLYNYLVN
mgnify:FL=1